MRILALNGASAVTGACFGLLTCSDDVIQVGSSCTVPGRGGAERLPVLLAERLQAAGWSASSLAMIAVVVGPGSFTGLRASLALAHGLALGSSASVIGVTVGEALGPALQSAAGDELVWCVSQARRDRVFIERPSRTGWTVEAAMLDALPHSRGSVLLGGDAEALVADRLDRQAVPLRRSGLATPSVGAIAAAALARRRGDMPPRDAQPLYVDPPEARPSPS